MSQNRLEAILAELSAQTGTQMPSAEQVQAFLSNPSCMYIMQSVLGQKSPSLNHAARMAKCGDYNGAANALSSFFATPEGQKFISQLRKNGGRNG